MCGTLRCRRINDGASLPHPWSKAMYDDLDCYRCREGILYSRIPANCALHKGCTLCHGTIPRCGRCKTPWISVPRRAEPRCITCEHDAYLTSTEFAGEEDLRRGSHPIGRTATANSQMVRFLVKKESSDADK